MCSERPCLVQICKSIEMKWLSCILLSALVAFIGVQGQGNGNCTYEECSQLLSSLREATPLSTEYCTKHNETFDCVNNNLQLCGSLNADIGYTIVVEWSTLPECSDNITVTTSAQVPTPTPGIDCTYTKCADLFHALSLNDSSSYCPQLGGVYNCLNATRNSCPNGAYVHNHDSIKMELDDLHSSSCTCSRCDHIYDALAALSPNETEYCLLHEEVNNCVQRIISICSSDDNLFWHGLSISLQLEQLANCSYTNNVTTPPSSSCLNGIVDEHVYVELNDNLPSFIDNSKLSTNCAAKHKENFYYCSLYSNSHLRAFNSNDLYTCSLPGLWALFNHPSLTVTVLNAVPDVNGPYTVVDELTVVITASDCSPETTYHASAVTDYFPTTFEDGTSGVNGLELIFNSNGTSGYIRVPWINTIIAIHKLARHIGIAVQSPVAVANKSVGLCSLGCPEHSKVTVIDFVDQDPTSSCTQEAYIACSINGLALANLDTNVKPTYYEKCIFDVLKSNNSNSSWISLAMVDSWYLLGPSSTARTNSPHSGSVPEYENQHTTGDTGSAANASAASTLCIAMVTWCLSSYAMLYILLS